MMPALSTQIFFSQRLRTSLLDALAKSGVQAVELFAARHHLDYTSRAEVREIASWFASNDVRPLLHAPISSEPEFSRHAAPNLNLVGLNKAQRIEAMEEIKRALECAELIPVATCVLHLGLRDPWSERVLEYALTAMEHLKAFASSLGVRLLLENLPNEVATPEHLLEILRVGHFDSCGVCLDVGHVHLTGLPFAEVFGILRERTLEVHLSDNHGPDGGRGDEHLWPASGTERPLSAARGTIDWQEVYRLLATLSQQVPGVLEIAEAQAGSPAEVSRLASEVFAHGAHLLEGPA